MYSEICHQWVAVDWGTTHLRAWIMDNNNTVTAHVSSNKGMSTLEPEAFAPTLYALLSPHISSHTITPVICCGMVGARQGWQEAPYQATPCAPSTPLTFIEPSADVPLWVGIAGGIKQIDPPDVMRGEETQISGVLSRNPDFRGVMCLPGTHCKWVYVEDGVIVGFQTFMTGELFASLCHHTILRHTFKNTDNTENVGYESIANSHAFLDAVERSYTSPQEVWGHLFSLRAGSLVAAQPRENPRAQLSGMLIGAELAIALQRWSEADIVLVGDNTLNILYNVAIAHVGFAATKLDSATLTREGLIIAWQQCRESFVTYMNTTDTNKE